MTPALSYLAAMVRKVRPARFVQHLMNLVHQDPQPTGAWTFEECGYTATPYGLVLGLPTRALVYWQTCATAWPGESYDSPEQPARGQPPPAMTMPTLPTVQMTPLVNVERYMGALLTGCANEETAAVELYADRPRPGAIPYGLNVRFHNGARIFLYARHCLPAGRGYTEGDAPFRRRDAI